MSLLVGEEERQIANRLRELTETDKIRWQQGSGSGMEYSAIYLGLELKITGISLPWFTLTIKSKQGESEFENKSSFTPLDDLLGEVEDQIRRGHVPRGNNVKQETDPHHETIWNVLDS